MEKSYRTIRIIHAGLLAAAVIYVVLAEQLGGKSSSTVDPLVVWVLTVMCLLNAATALVFRKKMVLDTATALSSDPENAALLNRWRTGSLIAAAMGESIVLFGLVLRFVGAQRSQAAVLYLLGIAVLIVATPKKPATEIAGMPPQP